MLDDDAPVTPLTPKAIARVPKFLSELRDNGGFVGKACEIAGVSRQSVYVWRKGNSEFAADWDRAVDLATEDLEKEVRRRALNGVEEPVFYKGEVCGQIRRYSDTLLMFAIKARRPEYRDTVKINVTPEDVEKAILQAHRETPGLVPLPPMFDREADGAVS